MTYKFVDTIETSDGVILPSEALQINGEFIENIIAGYRTLNVSGREALSAELDTYSVGVRDGSDIKGKRYPARIITVRYQLIAETNEAFREAYNQLASILNVDNAELIFNDEIDKFYIGTPETIEPVTAGLNSVIGEFTIYCADPFKYSVAEYEATPLLDNDSILIDYNGTHKSYPILEADFFEEDEGNGSSITGGGDCGYVAFFNENKKIIQLGDPSEEDSETYAKSQTLVNQKFTSSGAWGVAAKDLWNISEGELAIKPSAYIYTDMPETSGTLLKKSSKIAKPYIDYIVTAKAYDRTADSTKVKVTIKSALDIKVNSGATKIKAGAKVSLNKVELYSSSTTSTVAAKKTGTYYLWDSTVKNGRIRITDASKNVGKSSKVTGWVKTSALNLADASADGLGKEYGLKGCIKIGDGDWQNAIIKNESTSWKDNATHTVTLTFTVKDLATDTTELEDIKFKVERTDSKGGSVGELDETACSNLDITAYFAPIPEAYYLHPKASTGEGWHGAVITRNIPADDAGDSGAANFTLTYKQKMSIGKSDSDLKQLGIFKMQLLTANNKVLAEATVKKNSAGKQAYFECWLNDKEVGSTKLLDLSYNNKYLGNNNEAKGIKTVKTCSITKSGKKVTFNIGGYKKTHTLSDIKNEKAAKIRIKFYQYGDKSALSHNGLYYVKFVKNNCDTWEDIPNKFSANDIVEANCKNGEVYLNNTLTPALGALGNDWEEFYLTPGLNQIGFAYSDWVKAENAPQFKVRYREVYL